MIELLRAIKYKYLYFSASRCVANSNTIPKALPEVAFIIGCGRSGTTLLGELLSLHNDISYLFEPYYIWAAINPKLDILNLFNDIEALLILDQNFFLKSHIFSFLRCIERFSSDNKSQILIEKTPLNVFRIGWLNRISPSAKYIHIVRDGVNVCTSIEKLASTNSYKIFGKPALNQWWGNDYSKWKALNRDGISAGYFPHEVEMLDSHFSKAAYEWLLSLKEVDKWRSTLGDRLYEVTYDELIFSPNNTLRKLSNFLGLASQSEWLDQSVAKIKYSDSCIEDGPSLPVNMCEAFNQYQERYDFLHRVK
ncbi:MAG: sulfotransferase [Leptolyngbya sp. SIO3F4]|nr:sulfotransferase [Leptolyngbya sp. SIO3F4]